MNTNSVRRQVAAFRDAAVADGVLSDARSIEGPGFFAVDALSRLDDAALHAYLDRFLREQLRVSEFHPDAGRPVIIRDLARTREQLAAVAGSKYTYRELDDFTELIARTLRGLPVVSKVTRSGVLEERVFLEYSQERLASFGVNAGQLREILAARNISNAGGTIETGSRQLSVDPSGEFKSEQGARRRPGADAQRSAALSARPCRCVARVCQPADLPELLWVAERRRPAGRSRAASPSRFRCAPARRSRSSARPSIARWRSWAS